MKVIVPTVTTDSPAEYGQFLETWCGVTDLIHIDVTDGSFAPSNTLNLNQLYWRGSRYNYKPSLHLMMRRPTDWIDQIVSLQPDSVLLHAESDDAINKLPKMFEHLRRFGISVGIALLPNTDVSSAKELIKLVDKVLIFGGHLGYQGGVADLDQLRKIASIKAINNEAIIEWDGGASIDNIKQLSSSGCDVINVGGAISKSENQVETYRKMVDILLSNTQ